MNKKDQTIHTYNQSATFLAKKFDELGARVGDIEETLALVEQGNPSVVEIGCGNGRDAQEIVTRTDNYLGIDVSEKLIELARQKVPHANFQIADIENFSFPSGLDVIFAFASLIHVPREIFANILSESRAALNTNGVMRLSLKYAEVYSEITRSDEFGTRTYFLYSKKDIEDLSEGFVIIKNKLNNLRGQIWLEIILQKA